MSQSCIVSQLPDTQPTTGQAFSPRVAPRFQTMGQTSSRHSRLFVRNHAVVRHGSMRPTMGQAFSLCRVVNFQYSIGHTFSPRSGKGIAAEWTDPSGAHRAALRRGRSVEIRLWDRPFPRARKTTHRTGRFDLLYGSWPEQYGPDVFSREPTVGQTFSQRIGGTATDGQAFPCRTTGQTFFERHLQWDTADYRTGLFGVRGGGGWTDRFRPWWTSLWFVSGERSRLRDRPFLQGGRKERSSIGQTYRGRERGRYLEGSGGRGGRQMNGQTFSLVVCNGTGLLCRGRCRSAVRE